jgi:MscS family membrane protein
MEFTEWVNREIFRRFNEEEIDFAFPTQTIHIAGDDKRPLNVGTRQADNDS